MPAREAGALPRRLKATASSVSRDFCVCVCVRACVRERERELHHFYYSVQRVGNGLIRDVCVCVCVCVCVPERERVTSLCSVQRVGNRLNRGLFANKHHHCVSHATLFPSRA